MIESRFVRQAVKDIIVLREKIALSGGSSHNEFRFLTYKKKRLFRTLKMRYSEKYFNAVFYYPLTPVIDILYPFKPIDCQLIYFKLLELYLDSNGSIMILKNNKPYGINEKVEFIMQTLLDLTDEIIDD